MALKKEKYKYMVVNKKNEVISRHIKHSYAERFINSYAGSDILKIMDCQKISFLDRYFKSDEFQKNTTESIILYCEERIKKINEEKLQLTHFLNGLKEGIKILELEEAKNEIKIQRNQ